MSPERYQQLGDLFEEACDLGPKAQAELLGRLGARDAELARELGALLAQDRAPADTLDAGIHNAGLLPAALEDTASPGAAPGRALSLSGVAELEVIRALGEGGMGQVLLARQRSLDREVAVKVLRPGATSAGLAGSLFSEALLAGSLEHPNIVPVHLLARDEDGLPVLVMKRVEGVPWSRLLADKDHPGWAALLGGGADGLSANLSILSSVCHALHFAHSRGVIHRDIKPDNVMVGAFGEVYLVDWGIAARVSAGAAAEPVPGRVVGTPGYLAPEMLAEGGALDARTDVYLLGATLHYALTRTPRHPGRSLLERCRSALASAPVEYGPEVPEELGAICNRATSLNKEDRFPSAQAFRGALADFLRHRDSIRLGDRAWEGLAELRERLAAPAAAAAATDGAEPEGARPPHELMLQCQFGFHESLRIWPDNARARRGLRECLITMAGYELSQENLGRAQALLGEIDEPPAELEAQLRALQARAAERAAGEVRLRELLRERDWSAAARPRALFFLLASGLCLLLWRVAVRDQRAAPHVIPPLVLSLYMLAGLVVMLLLVALFRRRLLATAVSRHVVLGILCVTGGMCLSRALHAIPTAPTAAIVASDHVLVATATAMGGVMLARWLWLLTPLFVAGALFSRLWPAEAGASFGVASVLALGVALWFTPQGWGRYGGAG